ncbi:ser thr phosphatase family protein [Coleophoma cylindrospora]|uniref:Ser thr phosphatase family protein n=1 Tax=Coleophoma cylindrospora TaxID=1849047 RepID=A0A3D8QPD8_9HELO|nr:ser thr phosphatase family protein [Coleophoma cylindrospora]
MGLIESLRSAAAAFGDEPLLVSPDGQELNLATGYIPLLTNFSFEDQAAKGLRKRKSDDKPEPPVYFSALELVRDHQIVLLSGPSGSGKTSFAKHLGFVLATSGSIKAHPLVRNELGTVHVEHWDAVDVVPCYFTINGPESLKTTVDSTLPGLVRSYLADQPATQGSLLIILDTIDKAGDQGSIHLADLITFVQAFKNVKLLLLGESNHVKHWVLSPDVVRHDLLPLLEVQRRQAVSALTRIAPSQATIGIGAAAAVPVYFALTLQSRQQGDQAEELLDAWVDVVAPDKLDSDRIMTQAFERLKEMAIQHPQNKLSGSKESGVSPLLSNNAVQTLLAARYLVNLPLETGIALFHQSPLETEPILHSLLVRLSTAGKSDKLVERLIRGSGTNAQLGALLASDFIAETSSFRGKLLNQMLAIVADGTIPTMQRERAGGILSRLGDPRDLMSLTNVPAGEFTLGSETHPNSQPVEKVSLGSFRIGVYPVVNREFSIFVRETGRDWQSPDGFAPTRQNAPATDLTWYDALAYCAWLTRRWHLSGEISLHEHVRLPTEPEWERACRGDQNPTDSCKPIYPWGAEWQDDVANHEELGLNTTCSVGLFPKGRSPYGCYDMAGQVWEWCTTLWGEDMATPSFLYPWRNDGREALDAPGSIRRVLRGGCFSSGRLKACCTYRGSLEPAGFWRGNGFRIVVAPIRS